MRLGSGQHLGDIGRVGAVTTANAVVSQQPDVAEPSNRLIGAFRDAVGIRQTARSQTGQDGFELIRLEADQAEIEIGEPELLDLVAKLLEIPACPRRQLVVGQAVGSLFFFAPTACDHYRDRGQPQLCCRADAPVASDQHAVLVNKHRVGPSPSAKRVGKLVDVGLAMQTGIAGVGDQPLDRPVLNPLGRPGTCRARLGKPRLHDHIQFP
jgi:hypothetical protein